MKYTKIFALFVLFILFTCAISAEEKHGNSYEYPMLDVTVQFEIDSPISVAKQETIAARLAGVATLHNNNDNINNIICTLFGHNLSTSTVTVTRHRVSAHDPRCLLEFYDVESCSRCDYGVETFITSTFISCHPEDLIN